MLSGKESAKTEKMEHKKYPTVVRFDEEDLPALKSWKVGGKYKLTLEVEQMSMSKGEEYPGESDSKEKAMTRASFKVLSVTPYGSDTKDAKRPSMMAEAMKKKMM